EAADWAHAQGLPLLADYSLESGSSLPDAQEQAPDSIMLLSPHPNTEYHIDPNLDLSVQQIQIEVAAGQGVSEVAIWVDANLLGTVSSAPYQAWWTLSAGEHRFW